MRSKLTTTALWSTMFAVGASLLPTTAGADGYYGPRASAAQINRIIGSSTSHGGYGSHASYKSHHTGYHGGYKSHHRGYGGYSTHVGYGHYSGSYGHDLDDFDYVARPYRNYDGRLVYSYQTVSPFTDTVEYIEIEEYSQPVKRSAYQPAPMDEPEARTDVGQPILFMTGSELLSETAVADLDKIGEILGAYTDTDVKILLSAYTDASGTREQNVRISTKRIETVKTYLTEKFEIPADRFVEAAIGEATAPGIDDPYAPENRRVVVSLLGVDLDRPGDTPVASAKGDAVPQPKASYRAAAYETCTVPAYPYSSQKVTGRLVAAGFQDLDDFGGGRLIQVCKVSN